MLLRDIIEENDNYFMWTDLIGLLEKDSNYFMGRWRKANMQLFERKDLIDHVKSDEFSWELKHFIKFNLKARIAIRKGVVLKAAYDILWHAREMVDPKLMRKALASIPEQHVASNRATAMTVVGACSFSITTKVKVSQLKPLQSFMHSSIKTWRNQY